MPVGYGSISLTDVFGRRVWPFANDPLGARALLHLARALSIRPPDLFPPIVSAAGGLILAPTILRLLWLYLSGCTQTRCAIDVILVPKPVGHDIDVANFSRQ
jgi:hypothetical protein